MTASQKPASPTAGYELDHTLDGVVLVLAGYLFTRGGGFVLVGDCFRFCLRGDGCGGGGFGYKVCGFLRTRLERRTSTGMVAPLMLLTLSPLSGARSSSSISKWSSGSSVSPSIFSTLHGAMTASQNSGDLTVKSEVVLDCVVLVDVVGFLLLAAPELVVVEGGCFRFALRGGDGDAAGYNVCGLRRVRLDRLTSSDMVAPLRTRDQSWEISCGSVR